MITLPDQLPCQRNKSSTTAWWFPLLGPQVQEESLVLPESSVTAAAQARSCRPGRLCKSCVCSAAGDLPCAGLTEEGQVCFF